MHNIANFACFLHYNAGKKSSVYPCRKLKTGTVSLFNADPYAPRRHAKQTFRRGWASLGAHKTKICWIAAVAYFIRS